MYLECPDFKRCCFCLPLRHGILIFGYINLALTFLVVYLEIVMDFGFTWNSTLSIFRGVEIYAHLWIHFMLDALDFVFIIVLLVGAHMKNTQLLKIYYYYGILTIIASILIYIVVTIDPPLERENHYVILSLGITFIAMAMHAYLLLLIRTELKKLKYKEAHTYVNQMTEISLNQPEEIITNRNYL